MSIRFNRQLMQLLFIAAGCIALTYFISWCVNALAGTGPRLGPDWARGGPRRVPDKTVASVTRTMGRQEGMLYLHAVVRNGLLDFTPVAQVRLENPWLTDTDRQLLQEPQLLDLTRVASPDTSRLHVTLLQRRPSRHATHPTSANQSVTDTSRPRPSHHVTRPLSANEITPEGEVEAGSVTPRVRVAVPEREGVVPTKQKTVPPREKTVPRREETVPLRRENVPLKKETVPSRDNVIQSKEKTVSTRENAVPPKETTVPPKEETVPLKKETVTSGERAIPAKEMTVQSKAETVPLRDESVSLRVGDHVTVRVDLKDASGRAVTSGGAKVRVRAVSNAGRSAGQSGDGRPARRVMAMAGDVRDLGNGSYVTSLPLRWSGEVAVQAMLVQPAEFRRMLLTLLDRMKMLNQVVAIFSSGRVEEVTLCSFLPAVPGYRELCNLTAANSGMPWYCGRPSKPALNCGHWHWASNTNFPLRYPGLTSAEQQLMQRVSEQTLESTQLKEAITLKVDESETSQPTTRKICHGTAPRDTWTDQSPRGFWDNDEWRPLGCDLPPLTDSLLLSCLENTTVVFLGDSNALRMLESLNVTLGCREAEPRQELHQPVRLTCPGDLNLRWFPHAFPFFSGATRWTDARTKRAPGDALRSLPGAGRYVVVVHLYLHFSVAHTAVYARHARDTARAVRELVARNPRAKVLVRGPHAVLGGAFGLAGDYHAERCARVLRAAFVELRDRVALLDAWDMTVARGNVDLHPDAATVRALTSLMMTHVCPADILTMTHS